jgi:hypothetical protein
MSAPPDDRNDEGLTFPKDGLYDLTPEDLFEEARRLYDEFFAQQESIRAFRLAIVLFHLLDWVHPNGTTPAVYRELRQAPEPDGPIALVVRLHEDRMFAILRSICDNSKHYRLMRSEAFEKAVVRGFVAGKSVAGEKLGQMNLAVAVGDQVIWLRDVFRSVLDMYSEYFQRRGLEEVVRAAAKQKPPSC